MNIVCPWNTDLGIPRASTLMGYSLLSIGRVRIFLQEIVIRNQINYINPSLYEEFNVTPQILFLRKGFC